MLAWKLDGFPQSVHYAPAALLPILAQLDAAFRSQPWGGLETGGLLLGARHPNRIEIRDFLEIPCDHQFGPAWALTPTEIEAFRNRIAQAATTVVGCYRSVHCHADLFSLKDLALFDQLFPQPEMLALVIERTKDQPSRGILYTRHLDGLLHAVVPLYPHA